MTIPTGNKPTNALILFLSFCLFWAFIPTVHAATGRSLEPIITSTTLPFDDALRCIGANMIIQDKQRRITYGYSIAGAYSMTGVDLSMLMRMSLSRIAAASKGAIQISTMGMGPSDDAERGASNELSMRQLRPDTLASVVLPDWVISGGVVSITSDAGNQERGLQASGLRFNLDFGKSSSTTTVDLALWIQDFRTAVDHSEPVTVRITFHNTQRHAEIGFRWGHDQVIGLSWAASRDASDAFTDALQRALQWGVATLLAAHFELAPRVCGISSDFPSLETGASYRLR